MPPLTEVQIAKLQSSATAALPIADDPFQIIADPIGAERNAVIDWLAEAFESGLLLGVYGEPNPELREAREMIIQYQEAPPEDMSPESIVRWSGTDEYGTTWQSVMTMSEIPHKEGNPGRQFFKCGLPIPPLDPMDDGSDRSLMPLESQPSIPKLSEAQVMLAGSLFDPRKFDPAGGFWGQVTEGLSLSQPEAQSAARNIVVSRIWRRFALRFHQDLLGAKGCGLACWKFEDATELPMAAKALAKLSGCGDVSTRTATPDFPFNLVALMTSRNRGECEKIARKASDQWGRPLGRWISLRLV